MRIVEVRDATLDDALTASRSNGDLIRAARGSCFDDVEGVVAEHAIPYEFSVWR